MTMTEKDYYALLEVDRTASAEEIKKAYRRLARKHHPDVNPGDASAEEMFKKIGEAYQTLSDGEKRAIYDRYGKDGLRGGFGAGGGEDFGFGGFTDIFDMFFGGSARGRTRTGPSRGRDVRCDVEITLKEAALGTDKELTIPAAAECGACRGTGSSTGAPPRACEACRGAGEIRQARRTVLGQFVNVVPCDACSGTGRHIPNPCRTCGGYGMVRDVKKVSVSIPAGVETGQRLRLNGEGEMGERGGSRGDLYVFVTVREHEIFKRDGTELFCEAPVSFVQAALGAEVEIPTLYGLEKIEIQPGSQHGSICRLRGKGMPSLDRRGRGDLHVLLRVEVPRKLNAKQRKLLEEFGRECGEEAMSPAKGFFQRFIRNL